MPPKSLTKTAEQIAEWAGKQKPADSPAYSRVTADELNTMRLLNKQGKTQVEIAQILGRGQSTVSYWLNALTDTMPAATEYLRGSALRMAQNIVENGLARDHVQTLKGIGVLADDSQSQGLVIQIGIRDSDVTFACSTQAVTQDLHKLTGDHGSDNAHDVT